jgi:ABC-2 type transport system ATP-binding protein
VGYLPEQPYFYDNLGVREILEFYACLSGVARTSINDEVRRVLSVVGLSGRSHSKMRALSKGLTQRVALAQALLNHPRLLILDEPFSGLDPMGRREFRDIFADLKHRGVTIFMSSHILSDVEFLCDRASIMVKGEIKGIYDLKYSTQHFSKSSYQLVLRTDPSFVARCPVAPDSACSEDRFLRLQFTERGAAEQALQTAISLGHEVQNFEREHRSLEDVFMDIAEQEGLGVRG